MGLIYKVWSTKTDKIYIGQTTNKLCDRWKAHRHMGKLYTKMKNNPELRKVLNGGNSHLYNAMAMHGVETFHIEIIVEVDNEKLNEIEEEYINRFDCINKGYNIREGGNRTEHSLETRELIAQNTKAAFQDIKVVKKMRKHHDKLKGLPPKCCFGVSNKRECYRIRRHATIPDKCFYVVSYDSVEECKKALIDYIEEHSKNKIS